MRIAKETEQLFVAEEKPLIWGVLFTLFALASAFLAEQALTRGGDWHTLAAAIFCIVSGYLLFSTKRTWLILDREMNVADFRCGRTRHHTSIDALIGAEVQKRGDRHDLAIGTAIRGVPILLACTARNADKLDLCAQRLNAWLKGETAPQTAPAAEPMLDSPLLLT